VILIFDFDYTLYNPDTKEMYDDSELVLGELKDQGHTLFVLIEGDVDKEIEIASLNIELFFEKVYYIEKMNEEPFNEIMSTYSHEKTFYVVGDTLEKEIEIANTIGMTTLWYNRTGKPLPEDTPIMMQPRFEISALYDIMNFLP